MKVITSLSDADVARPSVVSIGNFDGLHLGHKEILKTVAARASDLGIRSVAMTFTPHPIQFLAPEQAPRLISTLDQKIRLIENTGIDFLFLARFDDAFSRLSPDEFINRYLIEGFQAHTVCVGANFNFGYKGAGNLETLRRFAHRFEIFEIPPVRARSFVVSSTKIRELIAAGTISRACRLLGRWFELEGSLVAAAGRGRTMSIPTLNLKPNNELIPKNGVYITRISLDGRPFMNSVTNIGVRPTFGENELAVETFVLNDSVPGDAVAARLHFLKRLRDEVKFENVEALRRQVALDVARTKRFFRWIQR